jgi:hypothetical protein
MFFPVWFPSILFARDGRIEFVLLLPFEPCGAEIGCVVGVCPAPSPPFDFQDVGCHGKVLLERRPAVEMWFYGQRKATGMRNDGTYESTPRVVAIFRTNRILHPFCSCGVTDRMHNENAIISVCSISVTQAYR